MHALFCFAACITAIKSQDSKANLPPFQLHCYGLAAIAADVSIAALRAFSWVCVA